MPVGGRVSRLMILDQGSLGRFRIGCPLRAEFVGWRVVLSPSSAVCISEQLEAV